MKQICLLTLDDNNLKNDLTQSMNKLIDVEVFDLDLLKKTNWVDCVADYLNKIEPNIIIHNYKLIGTDNENLILSHNYELTNILSDYSFVNRCKMIYLSNLNSEPQNLYEWTDLISERFVNQNGGVTLKIDKNLDGKLSKYLNYTIENYDEYEFYTHRISDLDIKIV